MIFVGLGCSNFMQLNVLYCLVLDIFSIYCIFYNIALVLHRLHNKNEVLASFYITKYSSGPVTIIGHMSTKSLTVYGWTLRKFGVM